MSDYNHTGLLGRVVSDAELETTSNGITFASFSLAVNRDRKKMDTSEWVSVPSFFNLRLYGKRAIGLHPYLKKGQPVIIGGHLEQRTWEKDGEKRYSTEIVVDTIDLAGFMQSKGQKTEPLIYSQADEENVDFPDIDTY